MNTIVGVNTRVAVELVRALQNGILSRREARTLVATALDELRSATHPESELRGIDAVIRAARHLQLARTTREYLAKFESRAAEVISSRRSELKQPGAVNSPELHERVRAALAGALGNAGLFSVTAAHDDHNVDLLVLATPVRVTLGATAAGAETVLDVELLEAPVTLDPEISQRLEGILRARSGLEDVDILAYAGRPALDGTQWSVTVRSPSGVHAQSLTVHESHAATLGPYLYDPDEAREMASQLALTHALHMAEDAGPIAQLEVLVRASMRTADEITPVAPEDSPVGVNERTESQWMVPSVWGDLAVYVTFERQSGAVRVEDFNGRLDASPRGPPRLPPSVGRPRRLRHLRAPERRGAGRGLQRTARRVTPRPTAADAVRRATSPSPSPSSARAWDVNGRRHDLRAPARAVEARADASSPPTTVARHRGVATVGGSPRNARA